MFNFVFILGDDVPPLLERKLVEMANQLRELNVVVKFIKNLANLAALENALKHAEFRVKDSTEVLVWGNTRPEADGTVTLGLAPNVRLSVATLVTTLARLMPEAIKVRNNQGVFVLACNPDGSLKSWLGGVTVASRLSRELLNNLTQGGTASVPVPVTIGFVGPVAVLDCVAYIHAYANAVQRDGQGTIVGDLNWRQFGVGKLALKAAVSACPFVFKHPKLCTTLHVTIPTTYSAAVTFRPAWQTMIDAHVAAEQTAAKAISQKQVAESGAQLGRLQVTSNNYVQTVGTQNAARRARSVLRLLMRAGNADVFRTFVAGLPGVVDPKAGGGFVDQADETGMTPLVDACLIGDVNMIGVLLGKQASPVVANVQGVTPLVATIHSGNIAAMKALLNAMTPAQLQATRSNRPGAPESPLYVAVERRLIDFARELIRLGFDPKHVLVTAIRRDSAAMIVALLGQNGICGLGDRIDGNGCTPLSYAATEGKATAIRALLELGADPLALDGKNESAIQVAASPPYTRDAVRALVSGSPKKFVPCRLPKYRWDQTKTQPLLNLAAAHRDLDTVKALLEAGESPQVQDSDGVTPLMAAAGNSAFEVVQLLVAKGADLNIVAGVETALDYALDAGRDDAFNIASSESVLRNARASLELIRWLISKGAQPKRSCAADTTKALKIGSNTLLLPSLPRGYQICTVIGEQTTIMENVLVCQCVTIGKNVLIETGVIVGDQVIIEQGAKVGKNTTIAHGMKITAGVTVAANLCVTHDGCFKRNADGTKGDRVGGLPAGVVDLGLWKPAEASLPFM